MNLQDAYRAAVASGRLRHDEAQQSALELLEELGSHAKGKERHLQRLAGFLGRKRRNSTGGIYLWGSVGRGKSMLMDLFFEQLPVIAKRRVHFLEFMQSVHSDLHEIRKTEVNDAILPVADGITRKVSHLCLDEMQIDDIADAMIVGRLFNRLFEKGVTVVTTSNRPPEDLYMDGLNRHLFLPFIELIRERMEVQEIGGKEDHRVGRLSTRQTYFVPADDVAKAEIDEIWNSLAGAGSGGKLVLPVRSRSVELPLFANGVARAGFDELCGKPYGPADYLAIAGAVRVLIIEDVPLLARSNRNETKRFVTLIDALYEARVRVVISAAAQPDGLHQGGRGSFEFRRTSSRIVEMQSNDWGDRQQ